MPELFEKAKALHAIGQLEAAEAAYREVLEHDTDCVRAQNNLGTVLQDLGRLEEAIASFRRAVEINPDLEAVHFNLGNALCTEGRLDEAIASYRRALELEPESIAAHYNLGTALHQAGRTEEAERSLRHALAFAPDSNMVNRKLGHVLLDQGRVNEAISCFRTVLQNNAESDEAHYDLGRALEAMGRLEDAAEAYEHVVRINPESGAARERLGRVLLASGRREAAIDVLRQWLDAAPDDPAAHHMLAACTGEAVAPRASDDYVRQVFDVFAHDYDRAMNRLAYRVPDLLAGLLADDEWTRGNLDVLDAGCGTGLCAPVLRPYARRLVGVDLSEGMVAEARERRLYDELVTAELTAFLSDWRESFDLIVAADTLVYFGALEAVLEAAVGTLRADGRLIFNVERLDEPEGGADHRLNPNGRYAHTEAYVASAVADAGLKVHAIASGTLRTEGAEPVAGLVVTASREAAT